LDVTYEHSKEITQRINFEAYDGMVAAGGDGTANEVLNGLMQAKESGLGTSVMGILPVGRGNDFAFGLGVPSQLEAACEILSQGSSRLIDIGRVAGGSYPQGRYFGNGVGIGFDAMVGFEALKMKRLSGLASYVIAALKTIFLYYKAPQVRIELDNQFYNLKALLISIMNGRRMGGGFMMAPQGVFDDGLLNIVIARSVSRSKIFILIRRFLQGTQASDPAILTACTRRIRVTAVEGTLPAHADGETLCTQGKQLTIELLPCQLKLICKG